MIKPASTDPQLASITETVELKKIKFGQDRDGMFICFEVDPQQFPEHLLKAPLGTRFMGALVMIDDNEQPVPKETKVQKEKRRQNSNVMRAAIACGEAGFQHFLQRRYAKQWAGALGSGADQAADTLRSILQIDSRKELMNNAQALAGFDKIMGEYEMWKRGE